MAQVSFLTAAVSIAFCLCLVLLVPPVMPDQQPQAIEARVEIPVSDPKVQKVSDLAVKSFNTQSGSESYYKATDVLKAESQVVEEGIKYYLIIDLVKTNCKKKEGYNLPQAELEKCAVPAGAEEQKYNCEFDIWLNEKKIGFKIQLWKRLSWECNTQLSDLAAQ